MNEVVVGFWGSGEDEVVGGVGGGRMALGGELGLGVLGVAVVEALFEPAAGAGRGDVERWWDGGDGGRGG